MRIEEANIMYEEEEKIWGRGNIWGRGRGSFLSLPPLSARIFTLWSETTKTSHMSVNAESPVCTLSTYICQTKHFHVQIVTLHFWRTIRNFWWVAHVGMITIAIFNAYFQYPLLWLQYLMYPWISPMAITQNYPDPLPPCSVCSTRHCKTPCSHLHGTVLKRTYNVWSCIITCSTQHCKY